MTTLQIAPYGTWDSPITSDLIVSQAIGLSGVTVDGESIYWIESRPCEGGRSVLVRYVPNQNPIDVTPPSFDVRSRVHEYGGGAFAAANGTVCFANFSDQRVYKIQSGSAPLPITPEANLRYADFVFDGTRGRLICVREDHRAKGQPVNTIVAINLAGDSDGGTILANGCDFYAAPRLSPDGSTLAWLSWDHPDMPWDSNCLWIAEFDADGKLGPRRRVAGGPSESVFQPEWSPNGILHFVSDKTGWWNLYRWHENRIEALCPVEADFGVPLWRLGMETYKFLSNGRIGCGYIENGMPRLGLIHEGRLEPVETPLRRIGAPHVYGQKVVLIGASACQPDAVLILDLRDGSMEMLKQSMSFELENGYVSKGEPIEFPTGDGLTSHAFYYPPTNKHFTAPSNELPPLMVRSHGGPTLATDSALSLEIQFWTSRGFAVVDVNYGGSAGFGRAYRARLDGAWGVVDVADCVNAARFLVERGLVDAERLCIRGSSAGGFTTLSALTFSNQFKAGASYYGIGDLVALTRETHKFESRYMDRIVGPLPEAAALYHERSPINFTNRLRCPVIFFQGLEDKVVPPNQAENMVSALQANGLPVAYLAFEGEGHGFRKAESIKRAIEAELYFYGQIFNFTPADDIAPVEIENLEKSLNELRLIHCG